MTRSNGESLRAGAVLGRYRIIEHIGAGGMGEVYRARDLDLDRDVAIKLLPSDLTGSEERVRRFILEAKSASGLNHPGIIVIHEIGKADIDGGTHHFIAMELIEGETLRQKIHKPHRDLKALLGYAAQCADALAKAHSAGIVHRDLKPDNLMVTRDGFAKVLDFGLAKLSEARAGSTESSATQVRPDTRDGVVMGTIGYMSPEQAQGMAVDARSDIFSFGCILFEIATGERAFKGASQVDVLHAIVHNDPPPVTDLNPNIPAELRRTIRRCLAKDPEQRFHSMKDLANTLRDLVDEYDQLTPGSGSAPRVAAASPAPRRTWLWIAAATAILVIGAIAGIAWYRKRGTAEVKPAAQMTLVPLTTRGRAYIAAISPDGRYVAYAQSDSGDSSIRIRQVSSPSEIEIRPATRERRYSGLQFSLDGESLFALDHPTGAPILKLVTMPTLGGEPRELIADVDSRPALSPDGRSLAFMRRESATQTSIFVADTTGANVRKVATRQEPEAYTNVSWSPDGKWLACSVDLTAGGVHSLIEVMSPDGTGRRKLTTERWFSISNFEWLPDMSGIAATGQRTETSRDQVWLIAWPDGRGRRMTNDLNAYSGISLRADGKAFVTLQYEFRPRIWHVDLASGDATPVTDERATRTPSTFQFDDAGNLVYAGFEGGTADLWIAARDSSSPPRQMTNDPGAEFSPALPADRKTIYYEREDPQGLELWSMDTRGGSRRRIAKLPPANTDIDCSPDGRYVIVPSSEGLLRVSTADGSQKTLSSIPSFHAHYSPDGTKIAFAPRGPEAGGTRRIVIIDAESGVMLGETPRLSQARRGFQWTRDGKSLLLVKEEDGIENLVVVLIGGGAARQLTKFTEKGTTFTGLAYASDGALYVGRASNAQDVVLISNFR